MAKKIPIVQATFYNNNTKQIENCYPMTSAKGVIMSDGKTLEESFSDKANDTNVVHKSGDEEILGRKTFDGFRANEFSLSDRGDWNRWVSAFYSFLEGQGIIQFGTEQDWSVILRNIADPEYENDAATKGYVDTKIGDASIPVLQYGALINNNIPSVFESEEHAIANAPIYAKILSGEVQFFAAKIGGVGLFVSRSISSNKSSFELIGLDFKNLAEILITINIDQSGLTQAVTLSKNLQSALTDTDGGYGQRIAELEKEGMASHEKLTELGKKFTNEYPFGLPVYVSSSEGSDDNDGTIERPFRTINFAIRVSNTIRLKCGDIFYESLHPDTPIITKNLDISSYGVGNKPMLCGYKIPHMNKGLWVNESENIWKINLADDSLDFDGYKTGSSLLNNIGAVVELDKDISSTCRKKTKAELSENYDIWQPATSYDIASDYDNLYMYYDGDPNQINLALCVYGSAFALRKSSVIVGLSIKGFGFGISLRSNSIIKDCDKIGRASCRERV